MLVDLERPDGYMGTLAWPVVQAVRSATANDAFRVTTAGNGSAHPEFDRLAHETLIKGELFGVGIALIILLAVFGAAIAAGLPVILAAASIVTAIGVTALLAQVFPMSTFVVNIITMTGLAVGIDSSLFIVHR